ncbi:hypothetical protein [Fortiea sp. LEGE XX443]|nr:hypothetical protein [Fortiea sp. LEGE XX443]
MSEFYSSCDEEEAIATKKDIKSSWLALAWLLAQGGDVISLLKTNRTFNSA